MYMNILLSTSDAFTTELSMNREVYLRADQNDNQNERSSCKYEYIVGVVETGSSRSIDGREKQNGDQFLSFFAVRDLCCLAELIGYE